MGAASVAVRIHLLQKLSSVGQKDLQEINCM